MNFQALKPSFLTKVFVGLIATSMLFVNCRKDDDPDPTDKPIASFQFEVSTDNFLEVTFTNFSQNATSYLWDFGDGETSTEKDVTHVYAAAGNYTVKLTVSNADGDEASRTVNISLSAPDELLTRLAGTASKTWYLQREGVALGIGPTIGDNAWWSFGGVTPLGDRPCVLDDSYTFHRDGTWEFNSNNTIFIDAAANGGWLDPTLPEGCHDESESGIWTSFATGEDVSAYKNGGNYTYEFDPVNGTITLLGEGAYIGLPQKTEEGDVVTPKSTKTYTIFNFAEGDIADSLQMAIVALDGGFSWNFYLVSYHNPADLPDLPSAEPQADFSYAKNGLEVTFTNASKNSTSYMWAFGDGATSTEVSPVHTYAAPGDYTVSLTAMDDMGGSDTKEEVITLTLDVFTPDVLSSATGKVWRLAGVGSYKVGDTPGSGVWWGGPSADDLVTRACQFDDEFIFFDNGTFEYKANGEVWAEGYMGGMDACMAEGSIPAPYGVYASGTHSFSAAGGAYPDGEVTVVGEGAFIGFNKPFNGGELDIASVLPPAQVTYKVFDYFKTSGGDETMVLVIDFSAGETGTAWWTITVTTAQ